MSTIPVKLEIDTTSYKILIVDDVISNIMLLKALLKTENYQVITANDGQEALDRVAEDAPDLILLDVMMPGMSGFDVSKTLQLSSEYSDIPIIFLTALNSHEDIVKGFELGANDFITKPFNKDELKIRIRHQISLIEAKRIIMKQTEELRQIIMGRDRLYSVIAHDLRGPLGSIKMILNLVLTDSDVSAISPAMIEMLKMANQTTEEVFALLDNLLKWTKSQLNRMVVAHQNIDISEIVHDARQIFLSMAEVKGIDVRIDHDLSTMVYADADMVKTVMRNLISNAIKFSNNDSEVSIGVESYDDDFVCVSVKDSGRGIDEQDKSKLLAADTHYSTFGTNNEEGSGLGLLLSDDFVRKNGGKLWFDSVQGVGSTFYFTLPKSKQE